MMGNFRKEVEAAIPERPRSKGGRTGRRTEVDSEINEVAIATIGSNGASNSARKVE